MAALAAADLALLEQLAKEEPALFAALLALVRAFLQERHRA